MDEYETPLAELTDRLVALGLRVEPDICGENDAEVYVGDEKLCVVHFNDAEEGWEVCDYLPMWSSLDDTVERVESELARHVEEKRRAARQLTFTVTVEYNAAALTPVPDAAAVLAGLVAKALAKLAPNRPKPRAVVVNGHRHSLRPTRASR